MFRSTALRKGPGLAIVLALVALLAPAGAQARPEAKTSQNGCANTNLKPTRANLELVRSAVLCLHNREREHDRKSWTLANSGGTEQGVRLPDASVGFRSAGSIDPKPLSIPSATRLTRFCEPRGFASRPRGRFALSGGEPTGVIGYGAPDLRESARR